jgi:uncharacterized protein
VIYLESHLIAVTSDVLARANSYDTRRLTSLHAIHLATADRYRPALTAFVIFDQELATAATALGLPVVSPV